MLVIMAKGGKFRVIPDGYTSSSLLRALKKDLNVPGLYVNLDVVKSLQPDEFMLTNAYATMINDTVLWPSSS